MYTLIIQWIFVLLYRYLYGRVVMVRENKSVIDDSDKIKGSGMRITLTGE